jgi:hypothetical protein
MKSGRRQAKPEMSYVGCKLSLKISIASRKPEKTKKKKKKKKTLQAPGRPQLCFSHHPDRTV